MGGGANQHTAHPPSWRDGRAARIAYISIGPSAHNSAKAAACCGPANRACRGDGRSRGWGWLTVRDRPAKWPTAPMTYLLVQSARGRWEAMTQTSAAPASSARDVRLCWEYVYVMLTSHLCDVQITFRAHSGLIQVTFPVCQGCVLAMFRLMWSARSWPWDIHRQSPQDGGRIRIFRYNRPQNGSTPNQI